MQPKNHTTYAALPFIIFGIILITAFFLKYFEPMLPVVLQNWADHFSIALIVAVVIGLTYEYTSHLFREEILKNLLYESQEQVYQALKAYNVLTPVEVFRLLKEDSQPDQSDTYPALPAATGKQRIHVYRKHGFFRHSGQYAA